MVTPRYDFLIIDYGHGGLIDGVYQTPGGKQYTHTDASPPLFLGEGISNRMTAAPLMNMGLRAGCRVIDAVAGREVTEMVTWRDLEQRDMPLRTRVANANQYPTGLMVSCHSNAVGNAIRGPSQSANGIDIYTSRGQTKADPIATTVFESFKANLGRQWGFGEGTLRLRRGDYSDGDPDKESDFYVLRKTVMPAVLGEIGFFTNLSDAKFLSNPDKHEIIAACYWLGVEGWLARSVRVEV